jgi:hypothetical protein
MTASTGQDRRERALASDHLASGQPIGAYWLVHAIRIFTVAALLAGAACLTVAFSFEHWPTAMAGSVLLVAATVGGAVWVLQNVVADRCAFYERGKLDGWMRGWRGQEPEAGYPLLRDR